MTPLIKGGEKKQLRIYFWLFKGAPSLPSVSVQKSAPSDTRKDFYLIGLIGLSSIAADLYRWTMSNAPKLTKKKPPEKYTLQGINKSHLGKRKIIFKSDFWWDMLIPWRVEDFLLLFLGQFLASFSGCDFFFEREAGIETASYQKYGHNQNRSHLFQGASFWVSIHWFCWGLGIHTRWAPTIVINGISFHHLLSFIARWRWILDLFSHPCKGDSIWTHVSKKNTSHDAIVESQDCLFTLQKNKTQEGAPLVIR